jgi:hypothetical protein
MHRLSVIIFSLLAPTLASVAVVIALVSGVSTLVPLLLAAGLGAVVAVPASYVLARALQNL